MLYCIIYILVFCYLGHDFAGYAVSKKSNQQDIRINRNDFNKRINSRYIQVWLDANVTGQSCNISQIPDKCCHPL